MVQGGFPLMKLSHTHTQIHATTTCDCRATAVLLYKIQQGFYFANLFFEKKN